ncbi:MAG TPA: TonB-dependent receptor plug domain-containing protein [Longimicrobiaceae bacterium]|jgi:hypothetical protein|nr:TonB-dependent receptor plug domain-containing protein [Longimicrobiaceae bacterium]
MNAARMIRSTAFRLVLALACALLAAPLAGQAVPAPRDTAKAPPQGIPVRTERDTVPRARRDSLPAGRDTAAVRIPGEARANDTLPDKAAHDTVPADSTLPAPNLPEYRRRGGGSWSGVWTWEKRDLDYFHGLSLLDLLERVPGVSVTRSGDFGQPAGVSAYALGGGRLRIYMNGFEIVPLGTGTLDPQQIALVDVETVRVERELTGIRVDITTYRLEDRRAFAQIEAADGDFSTRILRGFFARPIGASNVVEAGYDVVSTSGFLRRSQYSASTAVARFSHLFAPDRGVEIEYRSGKFDRGTNSTALTFPLSADRADLILRGRARLPGNLMLDAQVGRTTLKPAPSDSVTPSESQVQASARATLTLPVATLQGEARLFRAGHGYAGDGAELSLRADAGLSKFVAATGELRSVTSQGTTGLEMEGGVRVGPFAGFSAFGSVAAGKRPLTYTADSVRTRLTFGGLGGVVPSTVVDTIVGFRTTSGSINAARVGAEWSRGTALVGAAAVRTDADQVVPFGLGFDPGLAPVQAGAVNSIEAYASVPIYFQWARLDGWYSRTADTGGRPFLPVDRARAGITFHKVFYTGNLEPTARVEALVRGPATTLGVDSQGRLDYSGQTQRYALFNFYLQIRIIDVRLFLQTENLIGRRTAADIPGLFLPGTRNMYGFRWFFRN